MIKKITISDVASYDKEGVVLDNLQRVNFIYGGNGTGKTTISRFLAGPDDRPTRIKDNKKRQVDGISFKRDGSIEIVDKGLPYRYMELEKRDYRIFKSCKMEWEKRHHEVIVYNQDFKRQNLMEIMPGVFSMGDDNITRIQRFLKIRRKMIRMEKAGHEIGILPDYRHLEQWNNIDFEDDTRPYSVEPTLYIINNTLSRIGFTGFKLMKSRKNPYCYEIVRQDGTRVGETLSEGEITILTFLYFLQVVEGLGKSKAYSGQKVVVIDDPVSSLDYDAICVVSELTDELMDKARNGNRIEQVIMMSHNVNFFQGLSVRQPKDDIAYWKLIKRKGVSKAIACGTDSPVMSDYEMLWHELRNFKQGIENGNSKNVANLPNLMRRIVETYFVDYGGYDRGNLFEGNYVETPEVKQKVVTLMKWIDEGSHGTKDNLYAECGDTMGEQCMDAMEMLFREMGQEVHWRMMMDER